MLTVKHVQMWPFSMRSVKFNLHRRAKCYLPEGNRLCQMTKLFVGPFNGSIKMIDVTGKMMKYNVK